MNGDGEGRAHDSYRRQIPHYHGDIARVLFVLAALGIVLAASTGNDLPLTTLQAVVSAIVLVIMAGITNPAQSWIHWCNACIAALGSFVFGYSAILHYRAGYGLFDSAYMFSEGLAALFLLALYFTVRTVRGAMLRQSPIE